MNKMAVMSKKNGSLAGPNKDFDMVMIESLESYLIKSYEISLEINKTKNSAPPEISDFTRNLNLSIFFLSILQHQNSINLYQNLSYCINYHRQLIFVDSFSG